MRGKNCSPKKRNPAVMPCGKVSCERPGIRWNRIGGIRLPVKACRWPAKLGFRFCLNTVQGLYFRSTNMAGLNPENNLAKNQSAASASSAQRRLLRGLSTALRQPSREKVKVKSATAIPALTSGGLFVLLPRTHTRAGTPGPGVHVGLRDV